MNAGRGECLASALRRCFAQYRQHLSVDKVTAFLKGSVALPAWQTFYTAPSKVKESANE
jgi:hypothetical protein